MRFLGIDVGKKRIGLALSDKGGLMAFPYQTVWRGLHADPDCLKIIKDIVEKEGVERVIMGIPLNMKGELTKEAEDIRAFGEKLQKLINQPIIFVNEMFSSKLAARSGKEKLDEKAATLILQDYLDTLQQ